MAEEEYEVWLNAGRGSVAIKKFDVRGRDRAEIVIGGRKFNITPRERQMNQDLAAMDSLDIFTNGVLRPIRLIEGDEDMKALTQNPNHLSEEDMRELLTQNYRKIDARIEEITNSSTLERLLEIAQDETVGATVRTVGQLRARIQFLDPSKVQETTHIATVNDAMAGGIRPVTPR